MDFPLRLSAFELDGFTLPPIKEPFLSALQQPIQGIEPIDGLAGSNKTALEGYMQAVHRDLGMGTVGSAKFLFHCLKSGRKKFLAPFEQQLKDWRHGAGILDARRDELNNAEKPLKAEGDEATPALRRRVEELQNQLGLVEQLIVHEQSLSWIRPSTLHGHTVPGNAAEYYNTMKDIVNTSNKPWIPFSLPHDPLAEETIQAISPEDARTCEDAQDCEKLAQNSFVWGELCEEACNTLVFGRSLGQSDSFQTFLKKLIVRSQRLLVTEEDKVQKAPCEETKDLPIQEESDTDIKVILGQAANAEAAEKGKK
ncbi:hypothetical protein DL764_000484 [Monosporascus ibericus]|uniref:Uncharacterized protein n=1 Tax=Monosporascus ibericus TaxID=155417 RepID=A0A4Q4TVT2_9PEZI|nr:hypothetical protein DL764_000484 [Monosporascus ibericus]